MTGPEAAAAVDPKASAAAEPVIEIDKLSLTFQTRDTSGPSPCPMSTCRSTGAISFP